VNHAADDMIAAHRRRDNVMATLTIKEVECVKKQTTVGRDQIHVHVNGTHLVGPLTMGTKDVVTLSATFNFTNSANIELIEEDPGTDDNLGTVTATAAQAGLGTLSGTFHRLSGADYHIKYSVS
jgi:hypothetical protein